MCESNNAANNIDPIEVDKIPNNLNVITSFTQARLLLHRRWHGNNRVSGTCKECGAFCSVDHNELCFDCRV